MYFSLAFRSGSLARVMRTIARSADLEKHFWVVSECCGLMAYQCNLSVCLCRRFSTTFLCLAGAGMLCQSIMTMSLLIADRFVICAVFSERGLAQLVNCDIVYQTLFFYFSLKYCSRETLCLLLTVFPHQFQRVDVKHNSGPQEGSRIS